MTPVAPAPLPVQPALEELDRLIREQQRDDTPFARPGRMDVSLDAFPSPDVPRGRLSASDPRHGTLHCAKVLLCKCVKCRRASADYQREYNRRKGTKTRFVCACCGSTDVRRERVGS